MTITLQEQQSILATAKKSTHYQIQDNLLWLKIVSVDDSPSFKIHAVDPRDKTADPKAAFYLDVRKLDSVNDIAFANIEPVKLVEVGVTQCEMVFDELLMLKLRVQANIKAVSLDGIRQDMQDISRLLRYHKGGYDVRPYEWYDKQGCPVTTGTTVVALCNDIDEAFSRFNNSATRYHQIEPAFTNVPRWLSLMDLVINDLAAVVARQKVPSDDLKPR